MSIHLPAGMRLAREHVADIAASRDPQTQEKIVAARDAMWRMDINSLAMALADLVTAHVNGALIGVPTETAHASALLTRAGYIFDESTSRWISG